MTIQDDALTALRSWFKAATTATDPKLLVADDKTPRPAPPYVTFRVGVLRTIGQPDVISKTVDGADAVQVYQQGAIPCSIQGFGPGAREWWESARLALAGPAVQAIFVAAGFSTPSPSSRPIQLPALLGATIEDRFVVDFDLRCEITNTTLESIVTADTVEVGLDLRHTPDGPVTDSRDLTVTL